MVLVVRWQSSDPHRKGAHGELVKRVPTLMNHVVNGLLSRDFVFSCSKSPLLNALLSRNFDDFFPGFRPLISASPQRQVNGRSLDKHAVFVSVLARPSLDRHATDRQKTPKRQSIAKVVDKISRIKFCVQNQLKFVTKQFWWLRNYYDNSAKILINCLLTISFQTK